MQRMLAPALRMRPNMPASMACLTTMLTGSKRCWKTPARLRPVRRAVSAICSMACARASSGFSQSTCAPASRQATATSACELCGVQTLTACGRSRSSISAQSA